jgi:lipopolysaccharide export system protein LptC
MWGRYIRSALLILSGILAIFLVYLLSSQVESEQVPGGPVSSRLEHADAGIDHFTFTQSRSGAVQWQIQARHARLFETENRAALEGVQITLYGPKGRELRLEGDEGTIDTSKKNFVLAKREGSIAVQLENGYTILTNHLAWTDARREVSTSDAVKIIGNGLEVQGRGLVGKLDVEEFQILEDVHVAIVQ